MFRRIKRKIGKRNCILLSVLCGIFSVESIALAASFTGVAVLFAGIFAVVFVISALVLLSTAFWEDHEKEIMGEKKFSRSISKPLLSEIPLWVQRYLGKKNCLLFILLYLIFFVVCILLPFFIENGFRVALVIAILSFIMMFGLFVMLSAYWADETDEEDSTAYEDDLVDTEEYESIKTETMEVLNEEE